MFRPERPMVGQSLHPILGKLAKPKRSLCGWFFVGVCPKWGGSDQVRVGSGPGCGRVSTPHLGVFGQLVAVSAQDGSVSTKFGRQHVGKLDQIGAGSTKFDQLKGDRSCTPRGGPSCKDSVAIEQRLHTRSRFVPKAAHLCSTSCRPLFDKSRTGLAWCVIWLGGSKLSARNHKVLREKPQRLLKQCLTLVRDLFDQRFMSFRGSAGCWRDALEQLSSSGRVVSFTLEMLEQKRTCSTESADSPDPNV